MSFFLGICVLTGVVALATIANHPVDERLRLTLVAQGMLMGSGAYAYALVGAWSGFGWMGLVAAAVVAALLGSSLVLISGRVVRDEFALMTFAVQVSWGALIVTASPLTGGVLGINNLPRLPMQDFFTVHGAALLPVSVCLVLSIWLVRAAACRKIDSVAAVVARSRELAMTLGLPSASTRALYGAYLGVFMGVAGALYAGFLAFIEPSTFGPSLSMLILALVFILGRLGYIGLLVFLLLLIVMPEVLRLISISGLRAASIREAITGVVICGMVFVSAYQGASR